MQVYKLIEALETQLEITIRYSMLMKPKRSFTFAGQIGLSRVL